jgi:hypothetical protein
METVEGRRECGLDNVASEVIVTYRFRTPTSSTTSVMPSDAAISSQPQNTVVCTPSRQWYVRSCKHRGHRRFCPEQCRSGQATARRAALISASI